MLGRLGIWRHIAVIFTIGVCSVLAVLGIVGGRGERFDSKQITVSPAGGDGVRIREVVDQDFGNFNRHGYERNIPTDFGVPRDVTASSPDANADIGLSSPNFGEIRVRLGDADVTYSGQRRYILSYTLPEAELSTGVLDLDIIGAGEKFETGRFEVIITGFLLADTECNVGGGGDLGGCKLESVGSDYRVVFSPLREGDGVSIVGRIAGYTTAAEPALPDLPERAPDRRVMLALAMIPIGLVGAALVFVIFRRLGRNEVFSGGAVEAAYGALPTPVAVGPARKVPGSPVSTVSPVSTSLVADSQMDELATIEFVPPRGLEPWQGAVLLSEKINDKTVAAWFSALAAREAITLRDDEGDLTIGVGARRDELDKGDSAIIDQFLQGKAEVKLGTYDPKFAAAWKAVKRQQVAVVRAAGWWKRPPGVTAGLAVGRLKTLGTVVVLLLFFLGGSVWWAVSGAFHLVPLALLFGLVLPTIAACCVYATMLPSRTATGSALALMTESFRRFLAASEGRHVEWAWSQGLLREYSAWAVSLGTADAWGDALAASNVPPTALLGYNPLLVHSMSSSFASSHTAPSSSGSGGSSGGGVGGGGGGGSSGSW